MVKTGWKKIKFSPGYIRVEPCQEWTFHTTRSSRTAYDTVTQLGGWMVSSIWWIGRIQTGGELHIGKMTHGYKGHCALLSCAQQLCSRKLRVWDDSHQKADAWIKFIFTCLPGECCLCLGESMGVPEWWSLYCRSIILQRVCVLQGTRPDPTTFGAVLNFV